MGKDKTLELLGSFSCPKNSDVQDFLINVNKAIRLENTNNARTYLILSPHDLEILGYFSLTFKELVLENLSLSKSKVKVLDGISKNAQSVRAYLIGQIGKNAAISGNPLCLGKILEDVYSVIGQAQRLIGGRVVILECEDEPKLIRLYTSQGFELLETKADPQQPSLRTMYITLCE